MVSDKKDEPVEFKKEFLEKFSAARHEFNENRAGLVSHAVLMQRINGILAETRSKIHDSEGAPPPTIK